jgi:DNA excision repair protein ERCC-2
MRHFPFPKIRKPQREFMLDVETCIKTKKHLVADVPTGVGKTVATVYPALKYALKNDKVVFFVTPRHSQHRIVIETLKKIKNKGLKFRAVDFVGKKWLCSVLGIDSLSASDFFEYCKSVREDKKCQFYKRTKKNNFTRKAYACMSKMKDMILHAEDMRYFTDDLCTYEVALGLARKSDFIVLDYYHVFSLGAQLLPKTGKQLEDMILIVDEAHNLPDRMRSLLSRKLSELTLKYASKEAIKFGFDVRKELSQVKKALRSLGNEERIVEKDEFNIDEETIQTFEMCGKQVLENKKRTFIGRIASFLSLWRGPDNGFARILQKEEIRGKKVFSLSYECMDPSLITKDIFSNIHSSILMSGTLKPGKMYQDLLSLEKQRTVIKEYISGFPPENRLNIFVPNVTTRYSQRTTENYRRMSESLSRVINEVSGNVAVFFPSYEMRNQIFRLMPKLNKEILLEKPNLNKKEKTDLYEKFINSKDICLLGVQAGSFAEGADFPNSILKCVVIDGLSLEKPTLAVKSLIKYYEKKFGRGWDYAYIYPAIRRALQSSGRCIRSETDRAVCIFMDERFIWPRYRKLFEMDSPPNVTKKPENLIRRFFGS